MKIAYFDCFSGISGNMILGAFIDAGMSLDNLKEGLNLLCLDGYDIEVEKVVKSGVSATHIDVILKSEGHHHHDHFESHKSEKNDHAHDNRINSKHTHRNLSDIIEIIENSKLPIKVKDMSLAIFYRLAEAEAVVHNSTVNEVHFHEVGAVDAIVDIVGACYCFYYMGIEEIYSSTLILGSGTVKCQHGVIPVPAPATAILIKGISAKSGGIEAELTTPTGAAIITTVSHKYGPMPEMVIEAVGYGAGTYDFPARPNVLRLFIGEYESDNCKTENNEVSVITTNIDDSTPEMLGYIMDKLFEAGALDVTFTPVQMKKNRPAITLTVILNPHDEDKITDIIFTESSTIGFRKRREERVVLPRKNKNISTEYGKLAVKVVSYDGKDMIYPEYESAKELAEKNKVPIHKIYNLVK